MLIIGTFILALGAVLTVVTAWLGITGNLTWDPYVSRMSKLLWTLGFVLAVVMTVVFFGPAVALSAWPLAAGLPVGTFAVFSLLDRLFLPRKRPERTITFADGRRAKVDGKRKPFELL